MAKKPYDYKSNFVKILKSIKKIQRRIWTITLSNIFTTLAL